MTNYMNWIEKARIFIEVCEEDIAKGRYWLACFHAQQAAELYLKGVLVKLVGSFPFTHSLVELLEALENIGYKIPEKIYLYASSLEGHYSRARYPGLEIGGYSRHIAERCLEHAKKITFFAEKILEGQS